MKETRGLEEIRKAAKNLVGNGENTEYTKGICELIADLDEIEATDHTNRAIGIATELTGKIINLYSTPVAFFQPDVQTMIDNDIPSFMVWKDPAKLLEEYPKTKLSGYDVVDIAEPTFADLSLEEAIDHMKKLGGEYSYLVDQLDMSDPKKPINRVYLIAIDKDTSDTMGRHFEFRAIESLKEQVDKWEKELPFRKYELSTTVLDEDFEQEVLDALEELEVVF